MPSLNRRAARLAPRWRDGLAWALALLTLASGCDARPEPRGAGSLEALIDVPVRSDDVDAWASARDATGKVERSLDWREGSGGACHGIACLILLPVVVGAALVPRIHTTSVVRRGEQVIFIGGYDTEGGLVFGRLLDGEQYKEVAVLERPALGARFAAVVATVPVSSAGSDEGRVAIPLSSQVDLVARYQAALEAQTGSRSPLLLEMLTAREDEPLVAAAVREVVRRHDDAEVSSVLREICSFDRFQPSDPLATELVSSLRVSPGPLSTELVMNPCASYMHDEPARVRFLRADFDAWCAALGSETTVPVVTPFSGSRHSHPEDWIPVAEGCPPGIGRTRALFALSGPLTQAELRAGMNTRPDVFVPGLRMWNVDERALAFEALASEESRAMAIDVTTTISHSSFPPASSEEAGAFTATYFAGHGTSVAHDRKRILEALARRPQATLPAAARAQLDAALAQDDPNAAALALVLGDTRQALAVARSVDGPIDWSRTNAPVAHMVWARALVLAGCTEAEASGAVLAARSEGTTPTCVR
ncbi:MAG: hypothetical protein IPG17_05295 [Sandaracinaceae bacterium]|jgi:hypothetical protein|nr:hypothetical protein [Sandaracinaceae bacterium]MBK6807571.1 hypothetical protein [Sandaracinaceae bacterium]MBK7774482.1 hypothetical protein [Sandaracinaceae bacterium]MBK8588627.1 hypothetical protein [Sandaracinaceae bacterium]